MCGRVGFPAGDLALAGLPRGEADVHRLLDGLINGIRVEAEHGTDAGGGGWAKVRDVILFVGVQTNRAHQIHLNFVGHDEAMKQLRAGAAALLRHGEERRNVVAGVRIIRREKRIMHVEFAHGHAIGPRGPFAIESLVAWQAEERGATK